MSSDRFLGLLEEGISRFPKTLRSLGADAPAALSLLVRYREEILLENERQNLTRLLSPEEFYWGHIEDVFQLLENIQFDYPVIDLGTGGGIPGIPAAILSGQPWVLLDSELRKTEFLTRVTGTLGIQNTQVIHDRMEKALPGVGPKTLVSRAVGKTEKLFGWIKGCSTWNTLILFKGPAFDEEWSEFQRSKFRDKLSIESTHAYSAYSPSDYSTRERRIVRLARKR